MTGERPAVSRHSTRRAWSVTLTVALVAVAGSCGRDLQESAAGRGAGAYRANCAACHGAALEGTARGPSLLEPSAVALTDAEMAIIVRDGIDDSGDGVWRGMPGNGALRDAQVNEIVAFVRSEQRAAAAADGG
jgi:mono/diheme cytochrome c family protein